MCPDVRAVVGDEDRQVAYDENAALVRRRPHRGPLVEEDELRIFLKGDFTAKPPPRLHESRRIPGCQGFVPVDPGGAAMLGFEGGEKRIIVEPATLCLTKLLVVVASHGGRGGNEPQVRAPQQRHLPGNDRAKIYAVPRKRGQVHHITGSEQVFLYEPLWRDEQWVASKSGEYRIW